MSAKQSTERSIGSDLGKLLQSGDGADVTLVVGQSKVPAHGVILAARSPVFAAMLRHDMLEARSRHIKIADMRVEVLKQLLVFLYSDKAPQLASMAAELLAAAEKYDLPVLKNMCEQQMMQGICVENACTRAVLAVQYSCPGLRTATVEFIASYRDILTTYGWKQVLQDKADVALQILSQLAELPSRTPTQHPTRETPTIPQSAQSRIIPDELKRDMATRLLEAARNGRARETWALMTAGAQRDAVDDNKNTALHLAAAKGHATTVRCLINGGLDVNAVNYSKQTPLHMAAQGGDTDVIWMLVAASGKINAQDNQGQTPLHEAAKLQSKNNYSPGSIPQKQCEPVYAVGALFLAGARKDIENTYGRSPMDMATSFTKDAFSSSFSPYYDF